MRRLDEDGPDALLQLREPVNRFDDAVTALVHQLHRAAPGKGRRMKADLLARAGLHLASSTVRRMLHRPAPKPRPTVDPSPRPRPTKGVARDASVPRRVVTAKRPHHVWHVDLTTIPIGPPGTGFWVAWWPFTIVMRWVLSWHIALVLDHYSRALLAFRVMRREPNARAICALLNRAVARAGRAPTYIVTDRGAQFQDEYRAWCAKHRIKPRFGAVGQHGSIAIVERFILSLKEELLRRIYVPASHAAMVAAVGAYQDWYNVHRPHSALAGRTPSEVLHGPVALHPRERAPPARRPHRRLRLIVGHVRGFRELPIVELHDAA